VGQFRVADRVYARSLSSVPHGTLVRTELQNGAVVDLDLSDFIEARVAIVRHWQPAVVAFATSRLSAGGTMFDVGAHVGILSLGIAASCDGAVPEIHAFEPLPSNAERIRHNAGLNPEARVHVNAVAVGSEAGSAELSTPDPRVPSMGYVGAPAGDADGSTTSVPVVALDGYAEEKGIDRVDVLKVDVEGYEPHVLAGAERLLGEKRVRAVVCELNEAELTARGSSPDEIVATFARHGYSRHPLPNVGVRRWTSRLLKHSFDDAVFLP
jgi:FkbM family methyltransferase